MNLGQLSLGFLILGLLCISGLTDGASFAEHGR
jgi:hypothetical protein